MRDPKNVDDREQRLHEHLEHHRHREQDDRATDRPGGIVVMAAANRFADRLPETRGWLVRALHGGRSHRAGRRPNWPLAQSPACTEVSAVGPSNRFTTIAGRPPCITPTRCRIEIV